MTQPRALSREDLLTSLLRDVSRSFYLTLRVLPGVVRRQIGLAYLLARATDTIADTDLVPVAQRLDALHRLRESILDPNSDRPLDFGPLLGHQSLPAERVLLARVGQALEVLRGFAPADQQRIREVLSTITSGQELDLKRFEGADQARIVSLVTDAELDDYTFLVAGCVGQFWTRMCVAHLFPSPPSPEPAEPPAASGQSWFENFGVKFGKGLQLVNILRDLPRDLRIGRCYLPSELLAKVSLQPRDLLNPANESRLRPVYDRYLDRAEEFLKSGWTYTCAIPQSFARLRLACAWPILIGVRTLSGLRSNNVLDPSRKLKVSRAEVRGILVRTILLLPWRNRWEGLFGRECVRSPSLGRLGDPSA